MIKQVHIFVYGDVIGVGFRSWTKIQAKSFNVKGWVKNNYDKNCVEALLQAEEDRLEPMISKLRQGPPVAQVDEVEIIWEPITNSFKEFEII